MKFGLYIVLTILFGAFIAQILNENPGYISIYFRDYVIELSLIFFCFALILTFLFLHYLIKTLKAPKIILKKTRIAIQNKANNLLEKSYLEMLKGNYPIAEKYAKKARFNCSSPLLAYMQIIHATDAQKNRMQRDDWLKNAFKKFKYAEEVILYTQAKIQIRELNYEDARATLGKIIEKNPNNILAKELLTDLYIRFSEWESLSNDLDDIKNKSKFEKDKIDKLEILICNALINSKDNIKSIKKYWKGLSKSLKNNPILLNEYCLKLSSKNENENAKKEILSFMKKEYSNDLVKTFIKIHSNQTTDVIKKLSQWIEKYPQQTELLLMTAKVRIKNEEWDEAKNLVEKAISIEAKEESFFILGEILFHFGKVDSACEAYRKGMKMKINKSQPKISP